MARIELQRPKYTARGPMVYCLRYGRPYARSRPEKVVNPRTPDQVKARGAFKLMQLTLAPIRGLFQLGYAPRAKENDRKVSGYHLALGENLREAVSWDEKGNPYVDFTRLKISRGMVSLSGMTVKRAGDLLRITHSPLVDCRYEALLVAVYNRARGVWASFQGASDFYSGQHAVELPRGWRNDSLYCYVGAGSTGDQKRQHCESQFFEVGPATTVPAAPGGKGTRRSLCLQVMTVECAEAPEGARMVFVTGEYLVRRE